MTNSFILWLENIRWGGKVRFFKNCHIQMTLLTKFQLGIQEVCNAILGCHIQITGDISVSRQHAWFIVTQNGTSSVSTFLHYQLNFFDCNLQLKLTRTFRIWLENCELRAYSSQVAYLNSQLLF